MTTEHPSFIHLHLNTNYSLGHGLVEAGEAARVCKDFGMAACACTDHGTLDGAMGFKSAMEAQGVKPIYGCEFLVGDGQDDASNLPSSHRGMTLVCLAENLEGYRNLCRLASEIVLFDWGRVSCISKTALRRCHHGLIALSGGPTGEVARKCKEGPLAVDQVIAEYLDIFGKDNFYLELQDHGLSEEQSINQALLAAAERNGVPLVATNDVHYLTKEQARAHEIQLCICEHTQVNACDHRALPGGPEYYLKSSEEMAQLFHWCPEAVQNTVAIAERCNVVMPTTETDSNLSHKPSFKLPEDFTGTHDDYLRQVCKAGLKRRYGIDADAPVQTAEEQKVLDRLEKELDFIGRHSLANDFLVVWGLLWDAGQDVWRWYNMGYGAVCGSLVAYLMPLTDIDPLKYDLLFERFLTEENPAPYFCISELTFKNVLESPFATASRQYGVDKVARRIEVERIEPSRIVVNVAIALGCQAYHVLENLVRKEPTARLALQESRRLQRLVKEDALAKEIVESAIVLERTVLHATARRAGIIISDSPLRDFCAVNNLPMENCHLQLFDVKELGLLVIDLWLADRFVEDGVRAFLEKNGMAALNSSLPDDDMRAFDTLARDEDIFYCEAYSGDWDVKCKVDLAAILRKHTALEYSEVGHICAKVKPRSMEELIACYAICRPGPMAYLDEYLRRRAGEVPVVYETPELEPILKETSGLVLYQEQFLQIVHVIAGLSLDKADRLRRSISKRKTQEMAAWHDTFFAEARKRGFTDECIQAIWEKLLRHAGYCFLKAHAAARALLLYRVACIKANITL